MYELLFLVTGTLVSTGPDNEQKKKNRLSIFFGKFEKWHISPKEFAWHTNIADRKGTRFEVELGWSWSRVVLSYLKVWK